MDGGLISGIVLGIAIIAAGIYVSGGDLLTFWDLSSLMIVGGGVLAATLVHFRGEQIRNMLRLVQIALTRRKQSPRDAIRTVIELAEKARREGLLAMEDEASRLDDPFLRKGIQLVVDGSDPELVKSVLEIEIAFLEERHRMGQDLFRFMANVSPAFGMVGTIIGLVIMLGNLQDPDALGPGLALALITTFYGVVMSNLIFLPIAGKLRILTESEVLMREIMLEGILSVQQGENPRIIEEKLSSFLPPHQRAEYRRELEAEEEARRAGRGKAVSFDAR